MDGQRDPRLGCPLKFCLSAFVIGRDHVESWRSMPPRIGPDRPGKRGRTIGSQLDALPDKGPLKEGGSSR